MAHRRQSDLNLWPKGQQSRGCRLQALVPSLQDLHFFESFAGCAMATREVQSCFPALAARALDVEYSRTLDLTSHSGMGQLDLT